MIRIFFRHLVDSFKNLKRNGWMTVAAVSSVTITLILVGVFMSLILNTTKLASELEGNVRITAYMKLNVHDQAHTIQDPKNLAKQINNNEYQAVYHEITGVDHVAKATYSSRDSQLKNLTKSLGKQWNLFKGDANPLYDAYVVEADKPTNVKKVANEIKVLPGISSVNYGGATTNKIFGLSNAIRTWGLGAAILLIFVAVFLISNTIRMTIMSRSREIQIQRLVGAKNSYIRWPFFLEGAWVGLLGAIIPALLMSFAYGIAYSALEPPLEASSLRMIAPAQFIPQITILLFVVGIVIGALGSIISMRRFLKA